jgi:hypothetical protein
MLNLMLDRIVLHIDYYILLLYFLMKVSDPNFQYERVYRIKELLELP